MPRITAILDEVLPVLIPKLEQSGPYVTAREVAPASTVPDDVGLAEIQILVKIYMEMHGQPQQVVVDRVHPSIVAQRRTQTPNWALNISISRTLLKLSIA